MIKCWQDAVGSVGRKGPGEDRNLVFSWSGMEVRRKGSPKFSLDPHSWKGEHSTPASDPRWGSPTGTDTPWEGKESLGPEGGTPLLGPAQIPSSVPLKPGF